jgi:hypothetical protein
MGFSKLGPTRQLGLLVVVLLLDTLMVQLAVKEALLLKPTVLPILEQELVVLVALSEAVVLVLFSYAIQVFI